jgi:phosphate transport system substrate-binding protein
MNPDKSNNQNFILCNHCGYDTNPSTAKRCVKCGKPLNVTVLPNSNKAAKPEPKTFADWLLTPWMIRLLSGLVFLFVSWLIYCAFVTVNSVSKPDDVGVNSSGSNQNTAPDVKLYNSMKEIPKVPEGTFNYGGGSSFAALTAAGLNEAISAAHPNFRLRFTEPRDGKPGGKKGCSYAA